MRKFSILAAISATVALVANAAAAAPTYAGHQLAGQAKVELAAAEKLALKARPGVITDRELEKEAGGSGLRWSFDIKRDAKDGKILENKTEGPHPD